MYRFTKHEEKIAYAGMITGIIITLFFGFMFWLAIT